MSLKSFFPIFIFLLCCSQLLYSVDIIGGNVTTILISNVTITSAWDGFYGEILFNTTSSPQLVNVNGGNLTNLDLYVTAPPCATYTINSIHVIASNSTSLITPISSGNLTYLDNIMNNVEEKASNTFTIIDIYSLTYGTYTNVPSFNFKNKTAQLQFKEGYLNDAVGNLIFVSNVCFDCNDWNNSLSDYQIMLPKNITDVAQYYVWVDLDYTCTTTPVTPPSGKKHRIRYVDVTPIINVKALTETTHKITLQNYGSYNEDLQIILTLNNDYCTIISPSEIYIKRGTFEDIELEIYCTEPFQQTLVEILVKNTHIYEETSFIINILGECENDNDCDEGYFCNSQKLCEIKKEINEPCEENSHCVSNLCVNGICGVCSVNEDCEWDEQCVNGICKLIEGCGEIENHELIPYECCVNSDCSPYHICLNNKCVFKSLQLYLMIENDNILIEDQDYLFRIIDNLGTPIEGVMVESKLTSYSDENGYVHVQIPYDGIIYLQKENYYDKKIQLDYYKLGFFDYEYNQLTKRLVFTLYDSKNKPLKDVEVYVDGILVGKTDSNGKFYYRTLSHDIQVSFMKEKYIIKGEMLHLGVCDCFCNLLCPFIIISIIGSIILYKIRREMFFVPLVLFVVFYVVLDYDYYLLPIIVSIVTFAIMYFLFRHNKKQLPDKIHRKKTN